MRPRLAVIASVALALPAAIMTGPSAAAHGPQILALVGVGGAAAGAVEVESLEALGLDVASLRPGADSATVAVTWSSPIADLDLTVRRPDGSVAGTSAVSIAQPGTSHSESVTLTAPVAGTWTVDVAGTVSLGQAYHGAATTLSPL